MLLSDLAIGTKVADVNSKYNNKIIIWTVASKNHYGNNQVTLISDVLALKPSDAKETGNNNSRNSYGNNRYSLSNIHSWLNSNKDNWYKATHSLDATPSSGLVGANPYDTEKGFCTNLSSKFLSKVKTTTITTAIPTCDGGGSENINCKFYLPSLAEVGLGQENGISEGSQFPLFTDNASRIIEFGGASREWELRTPASNNGYDFRHIRPNGTNYTNVANNGYIGIRTVCNIDANIEVENKSSYYELKLSNYLNTNTSLSSALGVLENKKEAIKGLKEELYNSLIEKGTDASSNDTLGSLISKVSDIGIGKKWASGTSTLISKKVSEISTDGSNYVYSLACIEVLNLPFKPSLILAQSEKSNMHYLTYYGNLISENYIYCSAFYQTSVTLKQGIFFNNTNDVYVSHNSFCIPVSMASANNTVGNTVKWIAFE